MSNSIGIETFNPSHDMYGNPTAHYAVWFNGDILLTQHNRREQIGYCGKVNQAALHAINKLGFNIDPTGSTFERTGGIVYYPVLSIDDMAGAFLVTVTDLFGGDLNYSCVDRFKVNARTEIGAIRKVSQYCGLNFRRAFDNVYHSTSKATGLVIEPFNFELHNDLSGVKEI